MLMIAHCVTLCCSVLQCVAVCYSVLQCVAVCCSVLPLQEQGLIISHAYPLLWGRVCTGGEGGGGGFANHGSDIFI